MEMETEVTVVTRRAGLRLTPAQIAELVAAQVALRGMLDRIRVPLLPLDAEPAVTFSAALRP